MKKQEIKAQLQAEEGWTELELPKEYGMGRSFVAGDLSEDRLQVKYYIRKEDKRFFAKVFFGIHAQGPPFHAHGGSMAAVLDEAMGLSAWAWAESKALVAAKIEIEYINMLPLNKVVIVEVAPGKVEGRKVWMNAELKDSNGKIYSRGKGLYIKVSEDKMQKASS